MVVISENIMKVYQIVLADRLLTYDKIAEAAALSPVSVEDITSEYLHME